jgi:hypothetical protein
MTHLKDENKKTSQPEKSSGVNIIYDIVSVLYIICFVLYLAVKEELQIPPAIEWIIWILFAAAAAHIGGSINGGADKDN